MHLLGTVLKDKDMPFSSPPPSCWLESKRDRWDPESSWKSAYVGMETISGAMTAQSEAVPLTP